MLTRMWQSLSGPSGLEIVLDDGDEDASNDGDMLCPKSTEDAADALVRLSANLLVTTCQSLLNSTSHPLEQRSKNLNLLLWVC